MSTIDQYLFIYLSIAIFLAAMFFGGSTLGILAFVFVCLLLPIALAIRVTQLIRDREE